MKIRRIASHIAALALMIAASPAAFATTLLVRPDGQGLFPDLQSAIDAAAAGDTVLALPGTFAGEGNYFLDYHGKDICLRSQNGSSATIIDCSFQGPAVYLHNGETKAAIIQGFHILRGGSSGLNGGGVRCEHAEASLRDIWITGANPDYDGGISVGFGSADIDGFIIEDCDILGDAGGIGLFSADSTNIRNGILLDNSAGAYAGGIEVCYSVGVTIENVHLIGNHCSSIAGGGLRCNYAEVTVQNCLFQGNDARDGGAIAHTGSGLIVRDCVFIGNWDWRFGGAIYLDNSHDALIENCDFRGNNSDNAGIITVMNYSTAILRNLSIVDNNHGDAFSYGCCYNDITVENCLIAFNRGGYGFNMSQAATMDISCTDVFGNEYGDYGGGYPDQTGINGNISLDPLFCDPDYDSLGLADQSPCLPEHNDCGVIMGNHGAECVLTAVGAPMPPGVQLDASFPNPFNPSTTISFSLDRPTLVTLAIHDASGRLVRALAAERIFPAGRHQLRWDGLDTAGHLAPSGVYYYRLETPAGATAKPMLLVK